MDLSVKTVLLKTNVDVHYESILNMDLKKSGKLYSGSLSGSGSELCNVNSFNYFVT